MMAEMKLLGIDYGTKRVGIALSDDEGHLAFPCSVITSQGKPFSNSAWIEYLVDKVKKICKKEGVAVIVIGESRDFKQNENPIMPAVRVLKAVLEKETGLPVHFEPEMFTSLQARRAPAKQEKTRRPQKRKDVNAAAAALILQGYIDQKSNFNSKPLL